MGKRSKVGCSQAEVVVELIDEIHESDDLQISEVKTTRSHLTREPWRARADSTNLRKSGVAQGSTSQALQPYRSSEMVTQSHEWFACFRLSEVSCVIEY